MGLGGKGRTSANCSARSLDRHLRHPHRTAPDRQIIKPSPGSKMVFRQSMGWEGEKHLEKKKSRGRLITARPWQEGAGPSTIERKLGNIEGNCPKKFIEISRLPRQEER